MLVVEVYVKADWEIVGGDDDAEGRARKSKPDTVMLCCRPLGC